MPTYVYACDSCGSQFEQFQRFQDDPLTVCPCGKEGQVRRVFQPVGIVFKGSGWYVTDSRKGASSDDSTKPDGAKADSTKTDNTKTDSAKDSQAKDAAPAAESKPAESASSTA